jgi:ribosomal protein S12 methylthiotransferase
VFRTFHIVTLGCPKNRVDSEVIWAGAATQGLLATDDPAEADVIIVNTCAFIQSAVVESLDTIVEMGRYKEEGSCSQLIVCGCLTPRFKEELLSELPEVDLFVGPAEAGEIGRLLSRPPGGGRLSCASGQAFLPSADTPRVNSLSAGSAYLKVAEGCSRKCTFCVIPKLRGPQRSRPIDDLEAEAANLARLGIREVILVAQDLAGWGLDLPKKPRLSDLVEALADVSGIRWLRLMYLFPTEVPERLIRVMAENENVLPYLDLPFQHADAEILRRMRRGGDPETSVALVERLREKIPKVVLRTSLMTGFPGEDRAAFERLFAFVERCRFERLGVFVFSPEDETEAAGLSDPVGKDVAQKRHRELMTLQREIASEYHRSLVGTTQAAVVEAELEPGVFTGRLWSQAPEVDGRLTIGGRTKAGEIVPVRITKAGPYDLEGRVVYE